MARPKPAKPGRSQLIQAALLLKQASDPTRLRVLMRLVEQDRNVGELVEELGITNQPALSHHLALLRHGGLIEPRREGKNKVYSLTERGRMLCRAIAVLIS